MEKLLLQNFSSKARIDELRVKPGESDYTITVIVRGHSTNVYPRRSTSMPFLFRKLRFFIVFLLKSVHFKKTVPRILFLSKLWYFLF